MRSTARRCVGRTAPGRLEYRFLVTRMGEMKNNPERILVVLPTWVGDFIMATPTLRAIRTRYPDARISFLCVENLLDLIDSGDWMDEVLTWPGGHQRNSVRSLAALVRRLRRSRFDLAVLFPNSFRSALIAFAAGARRRVGYVRDGRGWLLTDRLDPPRVNGRIPPHPICDYYGRIAEALGCPSPGDRLELFTSSECEDSVERRIASLGIEDHEPMVVISPGASFGASKLWLPERFAEVADRLIESMGAAVIITCGPGEEAIARRIGGVMQHAAHVLDDPIARLGELKALIKRSALLICNDTGPRHIGKAFGIGVVTVFGPTHQAWTQTEYPLERRIQIEVDCGPCQKKVCEPGHLKCMTGVSVEMVYASCVELLRRRMARAAV